MIKRIAYSFSIIFFLASTIPTKASENRFEFFVGPGVADNDLALLKSGYEFADNFLQTELGISLSRVQKVYVSNDPKFLAKSYIKQKQIKNWDKQALKTWTHDRWNEAGYGFIMMKSSGATFSGGGGNASKYKLWPAVAHELFHLFQYDLAGSVSKKCCKQDRVSVVGPVWLMEGSAEYAMMLFRAKELSTDLDSLISSAQKTSIRTKKNLHDLEIGKNFYGISRAYEIGAYATHLLIQKVGLKGLVKFYQNVAKSKNWKKTFHNSFGVSVSEFYSEFSSAIK